MIKALLLAGLLVLAVGVGPAAAKTTPPCWKVLINDWYDGRIDSTYPIHCYREALQHLPTDVETYSSARDDIKQALQERITQSHKPGGGSTAGGTSGGSGGGTSGGSGGGKTANGPIGGVFNAGRPSTADSVPIPLIVLGGVALFLMAAGGAGFLIRRARLRKLQLASAASLPQQPPGPTPEQP